VLRSKLGGIPNWGHNRAVKTHRLVLNVSFVITKFFCQQVLTRWPNMSLISLRFSSVKFSLFRCFCWRCWLYTSDARLMTGSEAVEGAADDHAWTSWAVHDSWAESLHSDGGGVRWTVHRRTLCTRGLPRYVPCWMVHWPLISQLSC